MIWESGFTYITVHNSLFKSPCVNVVMILLNETISVFNGVPLAGSMVLGVYVHVPCCYQRPARYPGSKLQPVAMLVSQGHVTALAMLIKVTCAVISGHGVIQDKAAAESHVWVLDPTRASVSDDVHGS